MLVQVTSLIALSLGLAFCGPVSLVPLETDKKISNPSSKSNPYVSYQDTVSPVAPGGLSAQNIGPQPAPLPLPDAGLSFANATNGTNATDTSNLSKRLDPLARHLTMVECKSMLRHQPMCCKHGSGSHHHECRLVYEQGTTEPNKLATWYGCDKDYNHAYCCHDTRMRVGWVRGQWQCPFHLTFLDYQVNWGADRVLH